jgi:hypothetical protein
MTLTAGTRLGPYEILSPLGAGGMGEVWKARDTRLEREVAIKVLPASFSADPDRLRRFEQEARAAGLLNHPNVTAIFDIGEHDGAPYVVQELLEGETLRGTLAGGRLPPRKAIDFAIQIAHGLAAAHEKGIVHRDLKPENLFVTRDGRIKILDFGLAKLTSSKSGGTSLTELPTETAGTEPGIVLGTVGYMSPEQVRGQPADSRSDIFTLGAILYEMLSGRRPFRGDSAAETISAILKEDPPELSATNRSISPGLERVVRHCLEKNPEQRFQSARDLAFDLEVLSDVSAPGAVRPRSVSSLTARSARIAGAAAALLSAGILGALVTRWLARPAPVPVFQQLTFRRGSIISARFSPDGKTVVYAAALEGAHPELYTAQENSPESRSLGIKARFLDSVSRTGEMAFRLRLEGGPPVLARAPLGGGAAPREILDYVSGAAWDPDGRLAVIHREGAKVQLEWPIGTALAESATEFSYLRISPDGKLLAFFEGSKAVAETLTLSTIDRAGKKTTVASIQGPTGLAWHPVASELWVSSGGMSMGATDLVAFTKAGRRRLVDRLPGRFTLEDISSAGDLLVSQHNHRGVLLAKGAGEAKETDLSWLDNSHVADVGADGHTILVGESGVGGGSKSAIYVRKTDGSPAVRLGEGFGMGFSPDGRWVLAVTEQGHPPFTLLPTGPGTPRLLRPGKISSVGWGVVTPDGKRIVFFGTEGSGAWRLYVQEIAGGEPRAFSPEGYRLTYGNGVSPDGGLVAAVEAAAERVVLAPIEGGQIRPVPGLVSGELPVRWSADGTSLFIYRRGEIPARLFRVDVRTGTRTLWKEISPADPTGVNPYDGIFLNADASAYAYCYSRDFTDLYLVRGLK